MAVAVFQNQYTYILWVVTVVQLEKMANQKDARTTGLAVPIAAISLRCSIGCLT